MFFKSLEIQGFKSFPDRVKLQFDKGLTAIVGPNGSGKSNIGDAIRWVLGEQSTKTLRGNRMEDIIFAGTEQRRPTGFAAVTIQLNNENGQFGEAYGDTIAITRKLFRSGDSVYQLNGKNVRLKDVQELLMDTGMGRDGYAIIGQGRIAEIVSAKSTERRELFEEAAGVSKFRYKREEAERNLHAAEENMVRLQDIAASLESRIEPLRQQSEKAKQFLVLSEEQKKLEISLWMQQLQQLDVEKAGVQQQLSKLQREFQDALKTLETAEAAVQAQYREMQQSTVRMQQLREEIRNAEAASAQRAADIAVCENEILHAQQQQQRLTGQIAEAEASRTAAEQALKTCAEQWELTKLQLQKAEAECKAQESRRAEASAQAAAAAEALQNAEKALKEGYGIQSTHYAKAQALASRLETMQAQAVMQKAQAAAMRVQQSEIITAAKQAEETLQIAKQAEADQQAAFSQQQKRCADAQSAQEKQQQTLQQLTASVQAKQQRLSLLEEMEHSMEGYAGSVKAVLQAEKGSPHGVYGTVSQQITVDAKYSLAIETALGGSMQHLIVEDERTAKDWIQYLAKRRAGRATFLPLTSVRGQLLREPDLLQQKEVIDLACHLVRYDSKFTNIIHSLLGRIVVAENLDTATTLARRYGYRFRIVTLDGQIINAGGSFTGGSSQKNSGVLSRKNECEQLRLTLQKENEKLAAQKLLWESARKAAAEQTYLQQQAQQLLHDAASERLLAASQAEHCRQQVEQVKTQQQEQYQQLQKLEQEIAALQAEANAAQKLYTETNAGLQQAEALQETARQAQAQAAQQLTEVAEVLSGLQVQAAELRQNVANQQQNLQQQTQLMTQQQERQQTFRTEQRQWVQTAKEQTERQAELQKQQQESAEQTKRHQEALQQLQRIHAEQERSVRQKQEGLKEQTAAKERLAAAVTQTETRQHTLEEQKDQIVKQMLEQYDVLLSEAAKLATPITDDLQAKQQLNSLRQKIRALGTVNVTAIEEYKTVSEQWEFLSGQLADATKSKQELEALIVQLTGEMQRLFAERMEILNQNFRKIFRELFGGGEASLELSDPEDVLNSGIEIHVAPPGKVIKNLISLSGGEQSFVAIAIYFAILRMRPTPFCVMDEIDAALDEGNVQRYVQYLQQFMGTTQFILITHRRSAMEAADALYGVTMQEDGISRLLHMEQTEAASGSA